MKNELKLRVNVRDQPMTYWDIKKQTDTYIMFSASINSGKKKPDGTWDNINQSFTCFANGEAMAFIESNNLQQRTKIKVSGSLTMLPEKRPATGAKSEYPETIFSSASISVNEIEIVEDNSYSANNAPKTNSNNYRQQAKGLDKIEGVDDDIPF